MRKTLQYLLILMGVVFIVVIGFVIAVLIIFQYGICNNISSETIFNSQLITIIGILAALIVIGNVGQVIYIKSTFDEKVKQLAEEQDILRSDFKAFAEDYQKIIFNLREEIKQKKEMQNG